MSTNDVPGAKASNNDKLAMGCWAEANDDSLILIEGVSTAENRVIFSIFDLSNSEQPLEYRDSMPIDGFEEDFSYGDKSQDKWTWHDKTDFPWERVIKNFPDGSRLPSAESVLNAAKRVAKSRHLIASKVIKKEISHRMEQAFNVTKTGNIIIDKLQRALGELRK